MTMPPGLRKVVLTLHVTSSVGWLGAVAVFLAVAALALTSRDASTVRAAYLVMEPAGRLVLVPLAVAALITGLVQSLGSPWGLLRHYWVLFKLMINVFSLGILLLYQGTFRTLADVAATADDLGAVRNASPLQHSVLAMLLLLMATVLAIYKPRGMTRYGWRQAGGRLVSAPR